MVLNGTQFKLLRPALHLQAFSQSTKGITLSWRKPFPDLKPSSQYLIPQLFYHIVTWKVLNRHILETKNSIEMMFGPHFCINVLKGCI